MLLFRRVLFRSGTYYIYYWYEIYGESKGYYKVKLSLSGDNYKFLSKQQINSSDVPETFSDYVDNNNEEPEVKYDSYKDNNVEIVYPETAFDDNVEFSIEKVENVNNKNLDKLSEKYTVYEINATSNGVAVQPDGQISLKFAIPTGYSTNVSLYYIKADGSLEKVNGTVDSKTRTLTVNLTHFSTYALVDNSNSNPQTGDCVSGYMIIGVISLIGLMSMCLNIRRIN